MLCPGSIVPRRHRNCHPHRHVVSRRNYPSGPSVRPILIDRWRHTSCCKMQVRVGERDVEIAYFSVFCFLCCLGECVQNNYCIVLLHVYLLLVANIHINSHTRTRTDSRELWNRDASTSARKIGHGTTDL